MRPKQMHCGRTRRTTFTDYQPRRTRTRRLSPADAALCRRVRSGKSVVTYEPSAKAEVSRHAADIRRRRRQSAEGQTDRHRQSEMARIERCVRVRHSTRGKAGTWDRVGSTGRAPRLTRRGDRKIKASGRTAHRTARPVIHTPRFHHKSGRTEGCAAARLGRESFFPA